MSSHKGSTYGFKRTSSLLEGRIRRASETRGFAESRVLTNWVEIVGEQIAQMAHPINVSYARQGMGATLTLLTTGAQAPMVEMQKEVIRTRVNATYGYNAIARVKITQTAAQGFSEGKAVFQHKPKAVKPAITETTKVHAQSMSRDVSDSDLKRALETLAMNVLTKNQTKT